MNGLFIVLPILTLLMFDLGLTLKTDDFLLVVNRPKAAIIGLTGQILLLPVLAYVLSCVMGLSPYLTIGFMLIACSPGGSSSNVFSKLAGGEVALSVSLTALSSVITIFTIPPIMHFVTTRAGQGVDVNLPVGNLFVQNFITMLVPIGIGMVVRRKFPKAAKSIDAVLARMAFPALMLLAGLFFFQHKTTIYDNFVLLAPCIVLLLVLSVAISYLTAWRLGLSRAEQRTIVIEVGMQNAAQAIAVASSPYVFNDSALAIPAIIYALMMNVVLLLYVGIIRRVR